MEVLRNVCASVKRKNERRLLELLGKVVEPREQSKSVWRGLERLAFGAVCHFLRPFPLRITVFTVLHISTTSYLFSL